MQRLCDWDKGRPISVSYIYIYIYICIYNSLMRFSIEVYYEPANLSVHHVSRIRLQINYYSDWNSILYIVLCWMKWLNK